MVNGNPMLAPSPSALLLSTAPAKPVGRSGGRADWQDAAGFAALLAGQPPQAPSPAGRTVAAEPDGAPAPVVSGALQPGGFDAAVVGQDVPRPARLAEAATDGGKILPPILPPAHREPDTPVDAATGEGSRRGDHGAAHPADTADAREADDGGIASLSLPLASPALEPAPAASLWQAPAQSSPAGPADAQLPSRPVAPLPAAATGAEPPVHPEHPGKAERAAVAVPITVAVDPADPAAAEDRPPAETAALRPKPARASEPVRGDASLPQPTAPAVAAAPADPTAAPRLAPGAPGPVQMPSPADIGAALDRLVAAREALVPAAAALAIEHAEFGEVSIRFEQTSDGRLSAEVASADPALREVLNATVAAERGVSTAAEGDAGRPASQRGQSASGDAASSERGQSGDDRNPNQRRAQGRDRPAHAPGTPHPGVFA